MQVSAASVTGACLCGDVRFEVTLPVRFCAHCHCSMCRRAHGAPLVTWVGVPRPQLKMIAGEGRLVHYDSSATARRSFCGRCGSPLFFEGERWAGEVHVARAAIAGDVGVPVQAHCFWDDRATWMPIADPLPRLGGPSGTEPVG
ncbi:MAG: GFA family protein [Polyangiaceae bacterium]|nr:GFA family protein [Polyangiaceae bacterium]